MEQNYATVLCIRGASKVATNSVISAYSQLGEGDSDVGLISLQLGFTAILWVKLLEMFVTLLSLKYSLSVC